MEQSWNAKVLRNTLPNHQKYYFCLTKGTGYRSLPAFPDQFACQYVYSRDYSDQHSDPDDPI